MRDSNKKITGVQLIIVSVWISFTLVVFYYFLNSQLVDFDQHRKLSSIDIQQLASELTPYLTDTTASDKKVILHFSTPQCDCQKYSNQHIEKINNIAKNNNFDIKHISIKKNKFIPSTPAIAIVNEQKEIIYFGPYGQGLTCSDTDGFALTVLKNVLQGYMANMIISDAKGCYCDV